MSTCQELHDTCHQHIHTHTHCTSMNPPIIIEIHLQQISHNCTHKHTKHPRVTKTLSLLVFALVPGDFIFDLFSFKLCHKTLFRQWLNRTALDNCTEGIERKNEGQSDTIYSCYASCNINHDWSMSGWGVWVGCVGGRVHGWVCIVYIVQEIPWHLCLGSQDISRTGKEKKLSNEHQYTVHMHDLTNLCIRVGRSEPCIKVWQFLKLQTSEDKNFVLKQSKKRTSCSTKQHNGKKKSSDLSHNTLETNNSLNVCTLKNKGKPP